MCRPVSDSVFGQALDLLETLCAVSSPSGDCEGLARAAKLYGEALKARGLEVEIRDEADSNGIPLPVLYGRSPSTGRPPLFIIGHLDTVLPALPGTRKGGRLWATGSVDMKGGLAAFIGALDACLAEGRGLPEDVLVVVVPDEEVAGQISQRVVRQRGPESRGMWVLEPGQCQGTNADPKDGETLVIGRRGMLQWQLDVFGRSAHAGNGFWQGRSALVAAADFCVAARGLSAPDKGPTVNAGRLVAGEQGFVENLAAEAGLLFSPRQTNVVPDRARVEGEARFFEAADGLRLEASLARLAGGLADTHDVRSELAISNRIAILSPHADSRRWADVAVGLAAEHGWSLLAEEDRRGISFSNFLPEGCSIPVLDGLGPTGGGMHTRQEYVDLESLEKRIRLLAALLAADLG